ncbi:DUF523 domain-containing protein [Patescibacteria group bacterium]|nr:DUF523 domain-containing protein [Patescibacteria group bacterium]
MIMVSACLAGIKCRWDGRSRPYKKVVKLVKEGKVIPICPEQLGGLSTPREPAEQRRNKVFTKSGKDVTDLFRKGAKEALKLAKLVNCKEAILKSKSPSCGSGKIYDGTFSGRLIDGDGIFAALLKKEGIKVYTEKEIKKIKNL